MADPNEKKNFEQKNVLPDEIRAQLVASVDKNWDQIIQALMDLATGIWYQSDQYDKNGIMQSRRVYTKLPDSATAQYLANQVIGKPKESMSVEGKVNLIMDV